MMVARTLEHQEQRLTLREEVLRRDIVLPSRPT